MTPDGSRRIGSARRAGRSVLIFLLALTLMALVLPLDLAWPEARLILDAALMVVLAGYAAVLVRRRRWVPATPLDAGVVAVLAAATLATIFGLSPRLSAEWLLPLFALAGFYYLFVDALRRGALEAIFLPALLVFSAVIALVAATEWIGAYAGVGPLPLENGWPGLIDGRWPSVPYRLRLPLTNPNFLAALLVLLLPWVFLGSHRASGWPARLALGFLLAALLAALVATGSRGGVAGGLIGVGVAIAMSRLRPGRRTALIAAGGLLLAGGAVVWLSAGTGRSVLLDPAREFLFGQAWSTFAAHPLTGIGLGAFPRFQEPLPGALESSAIFRAPHNLYLTVAAETGLVGVLAAGLALGLLLLTGVRGWLAGDPTRRAALAATFGTLAGVLVHGLVDSFLFFGWYLLGIVFVAAVIAAPAARNQRLPGRIGVLAGAALAAGLVVGAGATLWLDLSRLWFTEGVLAAAAGRPAESLERFDLVARWDPVYPATAAQRGLVLRYAAPDDARVAAEAAALLDGIHHAGSLAPYYALRRDLALLAVGDRDAARAGFIAIAADPPSVPAALTAARALAALGEPEAAAAALRRAVLARPAVLRGTVWDELPVDRQQVIDAAWEEAAARPVTRAQIAAFADESERARAIYESLRGEQPALAHFGLACLALDRGDPAAALAHLETAEVTAPGEPFLQAARGRALVAAGQAVAGYRAIDEAVWLLLASDEAGAAAALWADLARRNGRAETANADSTPPAARPQVFYDIRLNRLALDPRFPLDPADLGQSGGQPAITWRVPAGSLARIPVECPA